MPEGSAFLDVPTLYALLTGMLLVQSVAWLLALRGRQPPVGARDWSAGFLLLSCGMLLLMTGSSSAIGITLRNVLLIAGHALMIHTLGKLLETPARRVVTLGAPLVALVGWPLLLLTVPDVIELRAALYSLLLTIMFFDLARVCFASTPVPDLLARLLGAFSIVHLSIHLMRAIASLLQVYRPGSMPLRQIEAVMISESILLLLSLSVIYAVKVFSQLNLSIADSNLALKREIEMRRNVWAELGAASQRNEAKKNWQQQFAVLLTREFRVPLEEVGAAAMRIGNHLGGDPAIAQRLEAIAGAVQRLRVLMGMYLLDQRLAGSEALLKKEPVRLDQLLQDVCNTHVTLQAQGRLQVQIPEDGIVTAGDAAMLAVAFGNLIDNALKYSPGNQPVEVSAVKSAEQVEVIIADRGIGIPTAELDRVGRRFFRGSNTAGLPGTGLGLYGAMEIARLHGGRITVSPRPVTGTVITVVLPVAEAAESRALHAI